MTTFGYDASGMLVEQVAPGNIRTTYAYDGAGRLVSQTDNAGQTMRFAYDAVGNQNLIFLPNGTMTRQEFDALGRVSRSYDGVNLDSAGNPITSAVYLSYNYDAASTYSATGAPSAVSQYSYDGEGHLTQVVAPDHTERYTYDSRNLLVKVQSGNRFTYYAYDGDGRRISKRVADASTGGAEVAAESSHLQYDGLYVIATRDAAGGLKSAYSRLPTGRLLSWFTPGPGTAATDNGGAILLDHLGSVVRMTKGTNGTVANAYSYDAFGTVTASTEGVPNDVKFTGAVLDSNGLYHLNARYYNPSVGRFITQVRIGGTRGSRGRRTSTRTPGTTQ